MEHGRGWVYPATTEVDFRDSSVLVGSDLHKWPGVMSPAWPAFTQLAHSLRLSAVVMLGDVLDGARVSRWPGLRGSAAPSLREELDAVEVDLRGIPDSVGRYWVLGNHDARPDAYVQSGAPEAADCMPTLSQRFPDWRMSHGLLSAGRVEFRHRWHKGIHAAYNNALRSGRSFVSADTHRLISTPVEDRNGRRYGVEVGMLADPAGPQFEYTEGAPTRWTCGFALLTFDGEGNLLPPELAEWHRGHMYFRGRPM